MALTISRKSFLPIPADAPIVVFPVQEKDHTRLPQGFKKVVAPRKLVRRNAVAGIGGQLRRVVLAAMAPEPRFVRMISGDLSVVILMVINGLKSLPSGERRLDFVLMLALRLSRL